MPIQTSSPVNTAFPSFMSVFGGSPGFRDDADDSEGVRVFPNTLNQNKQTTSSNQAVLAFPHRGSVTSLSDSTDSSPTTTNSTFDSVSMTDPSPSSSPESPTSLIPLSPFKSMMAESTPPLAEKDVPDFNSKPITNIPSPFISDSPGAKARNVKNLSLNMSPPTGRPSTSAGVPTAFALSAPTSPLKGARSARRRPANLTIQTPSFDKTSFNQTTADLVPPTPSNRPSLRHFESSPSLPSLLPPITAPPRGMQHQPSASLTSLHSRPGSQSSVSNQSSNGQPLENLQEEDVAPRSHEAQERGYTEGPARIYDSGVYLYLEPTKEEASKFDVVINVAKEVANPFTQALGQVKDTVVSVWRNGPTDLERKKTPEPLTAVSEVSFKSANEWPAASTPTTPRAEIAEPEYIHVPWDHNSEILEDLFPLCQVIDDRIQQGKSVLVHCQLGVSRSASLVIAYGLYKNQQSDFHSMYSSVKERSRWVGPNMSLIYQLMDFKTRCGKTPVVTWKVAPVEWFIIPPVDRRNDVTTTPKAAPLERITMFSSMPPPPPYPRMVSSSTQTDSELASNGRSATLIDNPVHRDPSSSESSSKLDSQIFKSMGRPPHSGKRNTPSPPPNAKRHAPRPLPLRQEPSPSARSVQAPRRPHVLLNSTRNSFRTVEMELMMQKPPSSPSLFSPRAIEFKSSPFYPRTSAAAGDLQPSSFRASMDLSGMPGAFPQSRPVSIMESAAGDMPWELVPTLDPTTPQPVDPRSPHQAGDKEIVRSIDDIL
ncbi:MAG: hypothetical protein Q9160_006345 [Pyrenula sp. 1 TL-2023]